MKPSRLRSTLSAEPLESRIAPALVISEILFAPAGSDFTDEYIEIRGNPGATIPEGTYFVHIEGDVGQEGGVQIVIDLGGLTLGPTGFAVWVQGNSTLALDPLATVFRGVGNSFGGAPRYSQDAGVDNIEGSTGTFMLITAPSAPLLTDDLDADNDGVGDGAVFSTWTVVESIGLHDGSDANDRVYGAINFGVPGAPTQSGGTISVLEFVPQYFGRVDGTVKNTVADWIAAGTVEASPDVYTLNATSVTPAAFASAALNHIGAPNFSRGVTVSGTTATWTDVDGDRVVAKRTKGTWSAGNFTALPLGLGVMIQAVEFQDVPGSLTIIARRGAAGGPGFPLSGNGTVDIGAIESDGVLLGDLTIDGDLGRLNAGFQGEFVKSIGNVTVGSIGARGAATLAVGSSAGFTVNGSMGTLTVLGDVNRVKIEVGAEGGGNAAAVIVRGSIIGGSATGEGSILVRGKAGTISVGGDLVGGTGDFTGNIEIENGAKVIRIGGSILGDDGGRSGSIRSNGRLQSFFVGGDIVGGRGESGAISTGGDDKAPAASIVVKGSIVGGTQVFPSISESASAELSIFNVRSVIIGGSVIGGGSFSAGVIQSEQGVGSIVIGGSVRAGDGAPGGQNLDIFRLNSLSIGGSVIGANGLALPLSVSERVGKLTIGGDIRTAGSEETLVEIGSAGSVTVKGSIVDDDAEQETVVSVRGVVGSFTVKGGVRGESSTVATLRFGAGDDFADPLPVPADLVVNNFKVLGGLSRVAIIFGDDEPASASAGTIFIGGDVSASRIVSGRAFSAGVDTILGSLDDVALPATEPDQVSRLASLIITGRVLGDDLAGPAHGIAFDQIKSATIAGEKIAFTSGEDLVFLGPDGGAFLRDSR